MVPEEVVDVDVLEVGEALVRYMIEREVAGEVMKPTSLMVHSPFVQQLSNKPLFVACYYLKLISTMCKEP